MPKAKKTISYDSPFPTRLRNKMEETGTTQAILAEKLGVQRQAVGKWCSGETIPDILSLGIMASYFNVSADWLLGLSEVQSTNITLREVCAFTGLSEQAATTLSSREGVILYRANTGEEAVDKVRCNFAPPPLQLNDLIEHPHFAKWMNSIITLKTWENARQLGKDKISSVLPRDLTYSFFLQHAVDIYRDMLKDIAPYNEKE